MKKQCLPVVLWAGVNPEASKAALFPTDWARINAPAASLAASLVPNPTTFSFKDSFVCAKGGRSPDSSLCSDTAPDRPPAPAVVVHPDGSVTPVPGGHNNNTTTTPHNATVPATNGTHPIANGTAPGLTPPLTPGPTPVAAANNGTTVPGVAPIANNGTGPPPPLQPPTTEPDGQQQPGGAAPTPAPRPSPLFPGEPTLDLPPTPAPATPAPDAAAAPTPAGATPAPGAAPAPTTPAVPAAGTPGAIQPPATPGAAAPGQPPVPVVRRPSLSHRPAAAAYCCFRH